MRYQKVDERQVSTGFEREFLWSYTDPGGSWVATGDARPGAPLVEGPTDWLTDPPAGEGWVQVGEQTNLIDGEQTPCSHRGRETR